MTDANRCQMCDAGREIHVHQLDETISTLSAAINANIGGVSKMEEDKRRSIYGDRKCANPLCDFGSGSALYCCNGCALAHEGHYEIHEDGPLGHSERCHRRLNPKTSEDLP